MPFKIACPHATCPCASALRVASAASGPISPISQVWYGIPYQRAPLTLLTSSAVPLGGGFPGSGRAVGEDRIAWAADEVTAVTDFDAHPNSLVAASLVCPIHMIRPMLTSAHTIDLTTFAGLPLVARKTMSTPSGAMKRANGFQIIANGTSIGLMIAPHIWATMLFGSSASWRIAMPSMTGRWTNSIRMPLETSVK